MKKLVSILLTLSIAAVALAQNQGGHKHGDWQKHFEKIKAERVAFITSEVGLTAQEAEVFWPVYNKIEAAQIELNKSERKAYMALCKALSTGEGDSAALLDAYLEAKAANVNQHVLNAKEYKKILSAEKVAKFFTCEEKFRMQQIGRLQGFKGKGGGQGGFNRGPRGERPSRDNKGDQSGKNI
jgi:Spy/CpxP family protein refolding chaperone